MKKITTLIAVASMGVASSGDLADAASDCPNDGTRVISFRHMH